MLIETQHQDGLDPVKDDRLPTKICDQCRKHLMDLSSGKREDKLKVFDYTRLNLPPERRNVPHVQNCYLCKSARENRVSKSKSPRKSSQDMNKSAQSNSPTARLTATPTPSASSTRSTRRTSGAHMCPSCLSVLGSGLRHKCTASTKSANLHALLSEKEKEQFASDVIKQKVDKSKSTASLSTRGSQLQVKLPPRPSKMRPPGQISAASLMTKMKNTRATYRGLKQYQE